MLLYTHNKEFYPSNIAMVLEALKGILEMDAIPKAAILNFIFDSVNQINVQEDGLIFGLSVFGTLLLLILIGTFCLILIRKVSSKCSNVMT